MFDQQRPVTQIGKRIHQFSRAVNPAAQELCLDTRRDHRHIHRLGHVIVGAAGKRVYRKLALVGGGHHDDGEFHLGAGCPQQPEQIEPARSRHHLVEQHQIVVRGLNLFQRLRPALGNLNRVTTAGQAAREGGPIAGIVVHHQ